jgi:hypothetical protein
MRDFSRAMFNFLMFVFLLVGCVHNIYHFQVIDENRERNYPSYQRRYSPTRATSYAYEEEEDALKEIASEDQALNDEEERDTQDVSVSYNY